MFWRLCIYAALPLLAAAGCALPRVEPERISLTVLMEEHSEALRGNPSLLLRCLRTIPPPESTSEPEIDSYLVRLARLGALSGDSNFQDQLTGRVCWAGRENRRKLVPCLEQAAFARAFLLLGEEIDRKEIRDLLFENRKCNELLLRLYMSGVSERDREDVLALLRDYPLLCSTAEELGLQEQALPVVREVLLEKWRDLERMTPIYMWYRRQAVPQDFHRLVDALWATVSKDDPEKYEWLVSQLANDGSNGAYRYLEKRGKLRIQPLYWPPQYYFYHSPMIWPGYGKSFICG